MRASVNMLCAVVLLTACSDGIGTPIQRRLPEQALDRDAASDEDRVFDELNEEHCEEALAWPASFEADEAELLDAINALRARSIRCGERAVEDMPPLRSSPALQCAARLHSRDMVQRGFDGRTNPDGEGLRDRIWAAGYRVEEADESRVIGERSVAGVLDRLLQPLDDCANVATRQLDEVGIGRYDDHWTLDFARD
jgi:uncharacterized protein YkwD